MLIGQRWGFGNGYADLARADDRARIASGEYQPFSREWTAIKNREAGGRPGVGPVLDALKGAEIAARRARKRFRVGLAGFGRTKAYDPLLDRTYDLESGELPPGLRGGGGGYTPEEIQQIQERLAARPSLSALEQEALRRVQAAGPRAVKTPVGL
jgi:hypothetical protein